MGEASRARVGWVGTGVMGASMCGHLLAAGHPVMLFSRTRSKAEPLLARGAKWADSPRDVAAAVDVVFTIVGFSLMKSSSCRASVRPPNTRTTMPETSGMIGSLRRSR